MPSGKFLEVYPRVFIFGAESTFQMASCFFEVKNIIKTLKIIIKRCEACQENNPKTEKLTKSGLQRSEKYPGGDWKIDFYSYVKS